MMRVILMGPPGAGKGTQGEILAHQWDVPRIAPGDIFRAEIKKGSELGLRVKSYSDAGKLVPDEVVIDLMRQQLTDDGAKAGWILDGFPRTIPQAEALDILLEELAQPCDRVVNLEVPEEILVQRLHRRSQEQGRVDDTAEVIANRLAEYFAKTRPLLEFYGPRVSHVDGTSPMSDVTIAICGCLGLSLTQEGTCS
ncbi:MAG: adenylate kinase [Oscillatoriales cyanobacterium SM2_2_1]|nr:adenylate kinase [Oscillatoriales cyanobacterium SM2_2_1]